MFGQPADICVHPYSNQPESNPSSSQSATSLRDPALDVNEANFFTTQYVTLPQQYDNDSDANSFRSGDQIHAARLPRSNSRSGRTTKSASSLHSSGFSYGDDNRSTKLAAESRQENPTELVCIELENPFTKAVHNGQVACDHAARASVSTPTLATLGSPLQIPYRYHCRISAMDYCIMGIMVPILLVRLTGLLILMISGWMIAKVALFDINKTNDLLTAAPLTGWRHKCQLIVRHIGRWMFFLCGLHWIRWEGRIEELRRRRKGQGVSAPVLVVAPHISYMDAFLCVILECGVVSRSTIKDIPFFGPAVTLMQPLFVDREDAQSRISTVETLRDRCRKDITMDRWNWPPVFIFPEGTTSNGKSLFKFKSGAFIPGQPVQLVGLTYKTLMRSFQPVTMTWDTNLPVWKSLICILLQPNITASVTALGVYHPSQDEQLNPDLYTTNVERYMSQQLGLPATEYTYQHAKNYAAAVYFRREAEGDRSSATSSTETVAADAYESRTRGNRKYSFRV